MYTQDYDQILPPYYRPGAAAANVTSSSPYGWADALQPYLKSTQIFQCPSESNGPGGTGSVDGLTPDPTVVGYTDYSMNLLASNRADATFNSPASTVLINDSYSQDASMWEAGGCAYVFGVNSQFTCPAGALTLATLNNTGAAPYPSARHLGGANFAFADGHVKWEKGVSDTSAQMAGVYWGSSTTTATSGAPTYSLQ